MKSFKHCVLKNNKSRFNDRKALIKRVLASDDDYTTEKKVTLKGEEYTPWAMYMSEKTGSVENYPEYSYIEFSLYIYDEIIDPIYYSEIFHLLRLAKPGDVMNIYINSPGGDINTLCSFAAALEETDAAIITHVDGSADSAAFVLAFMGDEIIFSEFSQLMTHNVSMSTSRMNMANLEKYAKVKGITCMNTSASITSLEFFKTMGYYVVSNQMVERRGVRIKRILMEKKL